MSDAPSAVEVINSRPGSCCSKVVLIRPVWRRIHARGSVIGRRGTLAGQKWRLFGTTVLRRRRGTNRRRGGRTTGKGTSCLFSERALLHDIKYLARWGKVCSCLLTFLVILALTVVSIWPPIITVTGTFGRVLECWDREKREHVAIKVVRSIRKYRRAAMIEIDVLNILARNDKGRSRCVQIRSWFDYRNHVCIVFEKLGPSLFDFLKRNRYCPFPVDLVREFGRQLLESVAYMHDLRLIHTDLKPENILLVSSEYVKVPSYKRNLQEMHSRYLPKSSAIKLIDFGSTAFEDQDRSSIVSTRQYRAPEIILGIGWDHPCDLWSIGCILVELCTGEQLFQTHENLEHLAMMERVLGPLPDHMIQKASSSASKYFKRGVRLNWPEGAESRESIRAVRKLDRLKDIVFRSVEHSGASLADLLYGLLTFKPSERLTAREALDHPFFGGP